jgi:hypothetical protein
MPIQAAADNLRRELDTTGSINAPHQGEQGAAVKEAGTTFTGSKSKAQAKKGAGSQVTATSLERSVPLSGSFPVHLVQCTRTRIHTHALAHTVLAHSLFGVTCTPTHTHALTHPHIRMHTLSGHSRALLVRIVSLCVVDYEHASNHEHASTCTHKARQAANGAGAA